MCLESSLEVTNTLLRAMKASFRGLMYIQNQSCFYKP